MKLWRKSAGNAERTWQGKWLVVLLVYMGVIGCLSGYTGTVALGAEVEQWGGRPENVIPGNVIPENAIPGNALPENGIAGAETETSKEEFPESGIREEDWESLDRFLQQESEQTGITVTFSQLMQQLMDGNGREAGRLILDSVQAVLFGEITHSGNMAGQLLALGMIGAVFAGFSEIFSGGQISETGFFLTYLMAFSVMTSAFFDSVAIAGEVLQKQIDFMKVLMPSYFLAVAWSGAGIASAAWYELVLFLIGAIQWLYRNLLIPLVRVYILLTMAGNMAKEDMLSRMTELLKTGIGWGTRSLIGLVLGFQLIQGMVLPYADAVRTSGVQKVLQVIPGVGQGASAVTKMILGSGVLIKNTMGAAAVLILLLLTLIPLLKLLIMLLMYRVVAAVIQPVGDKRLVACISSVADGQKLLLGMVFASLALFLITIALICAGTNVTYLA